MDVLVGQTVIASRSCQVGCWDDALVKGESYVVAQVLHLSHTTLISLKQSPKRFYPCVFFEVVPTDLKEEDFL